MRIDKFLVIGQTRGRYSYQKRTTIKMVEREPKLGMNEISLRLKLEIPDAIFERPQLVAEMKVPDSATPNVEITPEITSNIERIIKDTTGLTVVVGIEAHKEDGVEEVKEDPE